MQMPSRPSGKVRCTWIEVRGPSGADPGEIALVYYLVDGAMVVLTDAHGQRRTDEEGHSSQGGIGRGEDCAVVARRLARRPKPGLLESRERPLCYEKVFVI
jgi:hypothetical protein